MGSGQRPTARPGLSDQLDKLGGLALVPGMPVEVYIQTGDRSPMAYLMKPLADYFKLQALPWSYFVWLIGILLGYAFLTSMMKRYYIRRFGWQ